MKTAVIELARNWLNRAGYVIAKKDGLASLRARDAEAILHLLGTVEGVSLPGNQKRIDLLANLVGTTICEGLIILKHLHAGLRLEGDVCEFGVAQGATSALLANELGNNDKHLWLFDSFEGLPDPSPEDALIDDIFNLGSMQAYAGQMKNPRHRLESRLQAVAFPAERTHVVAGFFPGSAASNAPKRICFAYIDFDLYQPIKDALHFVDERMPPGGAIVVDDYGFFSAGAKKAVDDFVNSTGSFRAVPAPAAYGYFAVLEKH